MTRKITSILLLFVLLFVSAGAVLADGEKGDKKSEDAKTEDAKDGSGDGKHHGHPEAREHGNRLLFHNDQIAVLFHGNGHKAAPDLRVVFNGSVDDEKSGYRVKLERIYEASPNDPEHRLAGIDLSGSKDWNVQTVEGNGTLTLTMVRAVDQGIVTLAFHLDTVNSKVKFDVNVDNWRWTNTSDYLILDMLVQGKNLKNETGAKVSIEDAGYITWADNATATYGNTTSTIRVDSYQAPVRDEDHQHEDADDSEHEKAEAKSEHGGHIKLVFNGTGGYSKLAYDPELGVQSSSVSAVPGIAPIVAVVAVFGVALVVAGRRK